MKVGLRLPDAWGGGGREGERERWVNVLSTAPGKEPLRREKERTRHNAESWHLPPAAIGCFVFSSFCVWPPGLETFLCVEPSFVWWLGVSWETSFHM